MAGRYNMVCDQGSTFQLQFIISTSGTPWSLTGNYTARMKVKSFPNNTDSLIELTTANNRITFGPEEGKVNLTISATTTADLPVGRWIYDLEFESTSGVVTKILEGKFVVRQEITD